MSRRKTDETLFSVAANKKYLEALGMARYIADTTEYKIALARSELAAHSRDPSLRHLQSFKLLGCYLAGNLDLYVSYINTSAASPVYLEVLADDYCKLH